MTPLALLDLAERLDAAADYLSIDDADGERTLRSAAFAVRRQVARDMDWPNGGWSQ